MECSIPVMAGIVTPKRRPLGDGAGHLAHPTLAANMKHGASPSGEALFLARRWAPFILN